MQGTSWRLDAYSQRVHAPPGRRRRPLPPATLLGGQPLLPPHYWRLRRCGCDRVARRRVTARLVFGASSWPPDDGPLTTLLELRGKLKPLGLALQQVLQALWEAQRWWLQHALARIALGLSLLAAAATLASNAWAVPVINRQLLPQLQQSVSALLQREVALGPVRWVAPMGLLGITPLGCMGPVHVGPGRVEGSSAEVQRLMVGLDPVQSVLQGRVVLTVKAQDAQVDLVQASNYSWFGYPDDTTPSARNFVPGAGRGSGGGAGEGGAAPPSGRPRSASVQDGSSSSCSVQGPTAAGSMCSTAVMSAPAAASSACQRMTAAAGRAASANRQQQALLRRLSWALAQGAARPAVPSEGQPTVVLMGLGGSEPKRQQQSNTPSQLAVEQSQQSSSGIFGHKLGWPSGARRLAGAAQPLAPSAQQQPVGSSAQQRRLDTLNAVRLYAGRGFTLQQQISMHTAGDAVCTDVAAVRSVLSAPPAFSSSATSSSMTCPGSQHRKLRRRSDSSYERQKEQQLVAAASSSVATTSSLCGSLGVLGKHPPSHGSAFALNKQLRSLQAHSRLYSARASHMMRMAAEAAAEMPGAQAPGAVAPGLAAVEPVLLVTPAQRRDAVTRINCLPALTGTLTPPKHAPVLPTQSVAPSAAGNTGAAGDVGVDCQRGADGARRAASKVNRIGPMEAPDRLKQCARVGRTAHGPYASAVVDPATVQRKKVGSASLPWSQHRPPATALIASRIMARHGQARSESTASPPSNEAAPPATAASVNSSTASGAFHLAAPPVTDVDPTGSSAVKGSTTRRAPLMHPGYFTSATGPSYTPAPPEALIDARQRRSTLQAYARAVVNAAASHLRGIEVALGSIQVQNGTVDAHVHGEVLPRRFEDVAVSVRLGACYDKLSVDLTARPHERHPSSAKCTMPSPHAHRHLRHVTGTAAMLTHANDEPLPPVAKAPCAEDAVAERSSPPFSPAAFARHPTGGRLRIRVEASGITSGTVPPPPESVQGAAGSTEGGALDKSARRVPVLDILVEGRSLHAPIIERLIELPMDINEGRATGELRIHSHDAASWHFPEFYGRVDVRDADFHFWDATDDITGANLDLLFERDRLYLHNASGSFGAVPMTLTGDLDLNPEGGQYRLSANVSGVEVNQLRATLGVRPTPQPAAGGVAGVLHVTGPLEKPVFSGTAWAVRPNAAQLAECEQTEAVVALLGEPGAVGAWDRVPLSAAGAVFTLDTAKETFELHSAHGLLVDGGQLHGAGRMWVAPQAEVDPAAVSMHAEGHDLVAEAVARRYLPEGVALPPGMVLGHGTLTATLQGSHLEPTFEVAVQLPEASASCTAQLQRTTARLTMVSPHADAAVTAHLLPPSFDDVKAALTQTRATELAKPNIAGVDGELGLRGLDVVPLMAADGEVALRQLAVQSGQPLRLKLNGRARVSGVVSRDVKAQQQPARGAAADGNNISWVFAGDLGLESVRVNQLKLFQKLAGRLSLTADGISVHGKGLRASETLDLDLALPLPAPASSPSRQLPNGEADGSRETADVSSSMAGHATTESPQLHALAQRGGGGLQMRCGPLHVAANINAPGSQLDFKVAALKLDELELASLRGDVQEISFSLNFDTHTGRGKMALANPRYSGLRGDSLSGGVRWQRDVVRLERLVLQQQRSRYEMQGEYNLPPNTALPTSAADFMLPAAASDVAAAGGRWRVQVSVPWAELQEIVPAARLLQSATSLSPVEYERAKAAFLQAIDRSSIRAAELNAQLRLMAEQAQPAVADRGAGPDSVRGGDLHLPGLQDMRGQWSGSIQAYGGGSSASSCDFDVKGQSWQWGSYGLDALVANGSYHSEEGVQLQEFVLKAGDAKLSVRGSLLGEHQDASVLLTDFPMATLRPIFRAVPALQHTAPAVPAERPQPVASPRPLGMITNVVGRATKGLGLPGGGLGDADSPINGLLYVSGNIAGSRTQPTGEVAVRLYDAAVGQTRLSQAQASARLSESQQLSFNVELVPAEGHRQAGHVRAGGVVPIVDAGGGSKAGEHMDVRLSVKDGGMALLTSVTPDLRWQGGLAAIDVRLRGPVEQPVLSGSASISRATLDCPLLRFPLTNAGAELRAGAGMLTVEALEARCGRRGHIRARGSLPVYGRGRGAPLLATLQQQAQHHVASHRLTVEATGMELRLRNMYSGQYDAQLALTDSLASPTVAGNMRFSKGIVFIVPQGAQDVAGTGSGSSHTLLTPTGTGAGSQATSSSGASVAKVFDILTRGESGVAQQFEAAMRQEVESVEHIVEDAGQHNVSLDRLSICLGPDLRAMYPLVMNFGVEGELGVSGPAHPDQVRISGMVRLPSGDINLVATQLALDREHANLITFQPEHSGLDPLVDLVMNGGDLRVAIKGKASEWQEHLTLHYISSKARPDTGEQLDAADAARLFEDKLKAALLAEDGQLALSRLAGTTVSTLMPKIETQGTVGGTRWRLVSAPSIPGLLSLDPSLADPSNILSSITMGTEVEIQFGKKLQAAMIRKLQESDVTTQWSLNYKLNNKLRMQFNITSAPPFPKTLMFQYSSNDPA